MKFPGRDTAEGDAFKLFFIRQSKAGAVAGAQHPAVFLRQPPADNRSDRVEDIPARQVECRRDFRLSRRLIVPLLFHQFRAGKAELHACIGVNGIVDAPVIRAEATEHLTVCGIDDSVAFQCCDIALPQINIGADRRKGSNVGHALLPRFFTQIFVLHPQELRVAWYRRTNIEKRTEQALLRLLFRRRCDFFAALIRKSSDEI